MRGSKRTLGVTPTEIITGKKHSVSHLHVFDSIVFVHKHSSRKVKLYSHSTECILLRYITCAKGYQCFQRPTRKVLVSEDVQIIETYELDSSSTRIINDDP